MEYSFSKMESVTDLILRFRRPKRTCLKHVAEISMKVSLCRGDAVCKSKWIVGVSLIAIGVWGI